MNNYCSSRNSTKKRAKIHMDGCKQEIHHPSNHHLVKSTYEIRTCSSLPSIRPSNPRSRSPSWLHMTDWRVRCTFDVPTSGTSGTSQGRPDLMVEALRNIISEGPSFPAACGRWLRSQVGVRPASITGHHKIRKKFLRLLCWIWMMTLFLHNIEEISASLQLQNNLELITPAAEGRISQAPFRLQHQYNNLR